MDQTLIQYYLKELAQIEDDCAEFALMHPQVAGRLTLGNSGATDPHMRQLIESVAFIASRLKRHMDGLSGEIIHTLLHWLSPNLIRPLPSMAVVRFSPLSEKLEVVATEVPRGGLLSARVGQDGRCQWTATVGASLWPFELRTFWAGQDAERYERDIGVPSENCLVMRVISPRGRVKKGLPGNLSFFISGPLNRALAAIEAMALGVREIYLVADDGSWKQRLPASALRLAGFGGLDERLLPTFSEVENLGNMVLEYLAFPQRFCFFKIEGIVCPAACSHFDVVLCVDPKAVAALDAAKNSFLLNCAPVVNLYPRNSVPIAMQTRHAQPECLIPADSTVSGPWDVHSIKRVRVLGKKGELQVSEYFSSMENGAAQEVYWVESRRERISNTFSCASTVISFVDAERQLHDCAWESGDVALIDLICSNTSLPGLLGVGHAVECPRVTMNYQCVIETSVSPYAPPSLPQSMRMGQLLRAFSFRCTTPDAGTSMTAAVRNYLLTHNRGNTVFAQAQIDGLRQIGRTLVALPQKFSLGGDALGAGFRYDIQFNEQGQFGEGKYPLARIIKAFLEQRADGGTPQEVWMNDKNWGTVLVR